MLGIISDKIIDSCQSTDAERTSADKGGSTVHRPAVSNISPGMARLSHCLHCADLLASRPLWNLELRFAADTKAFGAAIGPPCSGYAPVRSTGCNERCRWFARIVGSDRFCGVSDRGDRSAWRHTWPAAPSMCLTTERRQAVGCARESTCSRQTARESWA